MPVYGGYRSLQAAQNEVRGVHEYDVPRNRGAENDRCSAEEFEGDNDTRVLLVYE